MQKENLKQLFSFYKTTLLLMYEAKHYLCQYGFYITYKDLNACTVILFNHDSTYRNKKFLLPRIVRYLKKKNFNKINEIFKENIYGDFSHAEDICNGITKLIELKKMPDKIILSSFKLSSINKLIKYGLNFYKYKINLNDPKINKKLLIGDNTLAKKTLSWTLKKDYFLAFKELLKKRI